MHCRSQCHSHGLANFLVVVVQLFKVLILIQQKYFSTKCSVAKGLPVGDPILHRSFHLVVSQIGLDRFEDLSVSPSAAGSSHQSTLQITAVFTETTRNIALSAVRKFL